jgi:hypothetical protein
MKHMVPGGRCEREEEKVCVFDKFKCDPVSSVRHRGFFGWQNPASFYFWTQKLALYRYRGGTTYEI